MPFTLLGFGETPLKGNSGISGAESVIGTDVDSDIGIVMDESIDNDIVVDQNVNGNGSPDLDTNIDGDGDGDGDLDLLDTEEAIDGEDSDPDAIVEFPNLAALVGAFAEDEEDEEDEEPDDSAPQGGMPDPVCLSARRVYYVLLSIYPERRQ